MGFNLPGKSMTSGTSSHSSALKMKVESNARASALKATDWEAMQAKSAKKDARYGKMSAADYKTEALRQSASKKAGKGYDAMGVYDSKGNKRSKSAKSTTKKRSISSDLKTKSTTFTPNPNIKTTFDATTGGLYKGSNKKTEMYGGSDSYTGHKSKGDAEKSENTQNKIARSKEKTAKLEKGKGSVEHLKAKLERQKTKMTDLQGGEGGKRAVLFGNLRRSINEKKQAKTIKKLDELTKK